jgi:hypothetical protein
MESYTQAKFVAHLRDVIREVVQEEMGTRSDRFDIEDYRGDIETMISEYINYNVTVTLEG